MQILYTISIHWLVNGEDNFKMWSLFHQSLVDAVMRSKYKCGRFPFLLQVPLMKLFFRAFMIHILRSDKKGS